MKEHEYISIKGAGEHNLKNIDVEIPKKKLVVFTGVSGSGKSSLAFDTIFAEGQRRYIESLSAYARQFIGQMEKPKYETIKGLSPTISIEQKSALTNPRSTVGTITEIYDYLRVLFARVGTQYCLKCGLEVGQSDPSDMVKQILDLPLGGKIMLLAPVVENRKGEHKDHLDNMKQQGFVRTRINGVIQRISEVQALAKHKKHNIEIVVDRFAVKNDVSFAKRLTESVETALKFGKGQLIIHNYDDKTDIRMSEARSCCQIAYPELDPTLFSFNSPRGMCPDCNGLGSVISMDVDKLIPDKNLSIRQGAVIPWRNYFLNQEARDGSWGVEQFKAMEKEWKLNYDLPWKKMPKKQRDLLLYGSEGKRVKVNWNSDKIQGAFNMKFEGLINTMTRRYMQTKSEGAKSWYAKFLSSQTCSTCGGRRLKPEIIAVKVSGESIMDITGMTIKEAYDFLRRLDLSANKRMIAKEVLKEIINRLRFLSDVGLDYLSLDRKGPTLSGGEAQRIRLASQIGSELTGVLYILDEPSIGLHQKDNQRLLNSLCHLRDIGNTVIVVEHDRETMETADWIVDIGPGAGRLGGEIVAAGPADKIKRHPDSLTGLYLSGRENIETPSERRDPKKNGNKWLTIQKAAENNLANIDVKIPLGTLVSVSGVSGAGKSTLINRVLYPALTRTLRQSTLLPGKHKSIKGLENIDKVINIDQKPIGRTPRSNPATYTKVFDHIRDLFAMLPESKTRGYKKGRFSFNVKGGRCEHCQGEGYIKVEMHFLADVFVPCEICGGKKFNKPTLEILYKGHSISDVLNLSVADAHQLFSAHPKIKAILETLLNVGLSYIKLGQSAVTLSGGEAQRIKLSRELAKRSTGRTLYILDEPTTGLHFQDIKMLLNVLQHLVTTGNTVVVIEHNLDVLKSSDWLIDLGPEGGDQGGRIIAEGPPEKVAEVKASHTGRYLKEVLFSKTTASQISS